MRNQFSVVFIAGYGRSGSTLLEKILNCHGSIFGAGELSYFSKELLREGASCSCGEPLSSCPIWRKVSADVLAETHAAPRELSDLQTAVEASTFWKGLSAVRVGRAGLEERYSAFSKSLYASIASHAPLGTKFIVDSSKTSYSSPRKPKLLAELGFAKVKAIHLVRDIRGAIHSIGNRGLNRDLDSGRAKRILLGDLRAICGWKYANRHAEELRTTLAAGDYMAIKYEELVGDIEGALRRIGAFLGVDLMEIAGQLGAGSLWAPSHQIACNRMRREPTVVLRPDDEWQQQMNSTSSAIARMMAGNQLRRYGYQ